MVLFKDLKGSIEEFKNINNEYIQIKLQEEKVKNKKTKTTQPEEDKNINEEGLAIVNSGGQQLQEITLQGEIERTMKQIVENYPEKLRQEIFDRLLVSFELKKLQDIGYLKQKCLRKLPSG